MTDYQKKRITLMRKQNIGYSAIAKELRLSLGSVKAYCRRNGLQSTDITTATQPENKSETPPDIDLISVENRGNSTTAKKPRNLENTGLLDDQPVCEITISYADKEDKAAIADVLDMLMKANYGG